MGLQAELERIRSIVCHNCTERISGNFGQHSPVSASQIPAIPTHNGGRQQVPVVLPHIATGTPVSFPSPPDGHNSISPTQLTNTSFSSQIPTTLSSSYNNLVMSTVPSVPTPPDSAESSPTWSGNETAAPLWSINETPAPSWSVIYNTDIEKALDVTFVHAFHHTSPVCAVRFSPDGRFLAAVLDCDIGMIQIYDMDSKSLKWYVSYRFRPNISTDVSVLSSLAEPRPLDSDENENILRGIWCICFSSDGRYVAVGSSFERIYVRSHLLSMAISLMIYSRYGILPVKRY